jgi:hypothetical protein
MEGVDNGTRFLPLLVQLFKFLPWENDIKTLGLVCKSFAATRRVYYLQHRVVWKFHYMLEADWKKFQESVLFSKGIFPRHYDFDGVGYVESMLPKLRDAVESITFKVPIDTDMETLCVKNFCSVQELRWNPLTQVGGFLGCPQHIRCVTLLIPREDVKFFVCSSELEELSLTQSTSVLKRYSIRIVHAPMLKKLRIEGVGKNFNSILKSLPGCVKDIQFQVDLGNFYMGDFSLNTKYLNGSILRVNELPSGIESFHVEWVGGGLGMYRAIQLSLILSDQPDIGLKRLCLKSADSEFEKVSLPMYPELRMLDISASKEVLFKHGFAGSLSSVRHLSIETLHISSNLTEDSGSSFFESLSPNINYLNLSSLYGGRHRNVDKIVKLGSTRDRKIDLTFSSTFLRLPHLSHVLLNYVNVDLYCDEADFTRFHTFSLKKCFAIRGIIRNLNCQRRLHLHPLSPPNPFIPKEHSLAVVNTEDTSPSVMVKLCYLSYEIMKKQK